MILKFNIRWNHRVLYRKDLIGASSTERLSINSVGSAQFKGANAPSGLDTRISQYGSLLVGTSGELISNNSQCNWCSSGTRDIKTIGNGEFSSVNQDSIKQV